MSDESTGQKPWAVLAYTVADDKSGGSSLDAAAKLELKALCDAADFDEIDIAAQVDFKHSRGIFRGVLTEKPRAFEEIDPEDHPLWRSIVGSIRKSKLKVLLEKEDLNAARADVLQDFLRFGAARCDARRYVLAFYGHAYGPMGLFFDADAGSRDATTLRLNDLASTIEGVERKAAVLVFRDCFMCTLETAWQLRGAGEFMVASQSVVPVAGVWPWGTLLTALMPSAASGDVGVAMVRQLGRFLDEPANRGPFADVPYSLIDLGAVDAAGEPMRALVGALEGARAQPARATACARALERARVGFPDDASNPGDPALLDLLTMCDGLQALEGDAVAGPARALGEIVRDRVVRWRWSQKEAHRGISLYYQPTAPRDIERSFIMSGDPTAAARDAAYYSELALCAATGWHTIALNPLT